MQLSLPDESTNFKFDQIYTKIVPTLTGAQAVPYIPQSISTSNCIGCMHVSSIGVKRQVIRDCLIS
jgi:hypothetical protein